MRGRRRCDVNIEKHAWEVKVRGLKGKKVNTYHIDRFLQTMCEPTSASPTGACVSRDAELNSNLH
jgi:hypothetical protein